jgi:hypothetical protein
MENFQKLSKFHLIIHIYIKQFTIDLSFLLREYELSDSEVPRRSSLNR